MIQQKHPVLVLMRHGQSEWNKKNLFTGWVDVPLSMEGIQEALEGGKKIAKIPFDVIFISTLVRSSQTAFLAMSEHHAGKTPVIIHPKDTKQGKWSQIYSEKTYEEIIPVYQAMELNERMYGRLQGMNKDETRQEFGEEQVKLWRRSYNVSPPDGESLSMTAERALPYFDNEIVPYLQKGQNVFVSAHGNSLRAIVMELDGLTEEEVLSLEIPTGEPLCYYFDQGSWHKKDIKELQKDYDR